MHRPFVLAFMPLVAAATVLAACGTVPAVRAASLDVQRLALAAKKPVKPVAPIAQDLDSGYLAVEFAPDADVANCVRGIIGPLGFVDPGHMIPPREPDVLHATVAYFHNHLPDPIEDKFQARFKGKFEQLSISGTGVANNQVAYLTLTGIEDARKELKALSIPCEMDDPHITIGASPSNPRDVHGVPKLAQRAVGPFTVKASYHFYWVTAGQMRLRW